MALFRRFGYTTLASAIGALAYHYWPSAELLTLETGQTYECTTQEYIGYLRPIEDGAKAEYFVDNGNLLVKPQIVSLLTKDEKIYIKLEDSEQECTLNPFHDNELREIPEGNDFMEKRFGVKTTHDVHYATAQGYWSSYPENFKSFVDIYSDKEKELRSKIKPLDLTMDIYEPKDGRLYKRPLVVMVHGGAFYNGDKRDEEYTAWCRDLASYGYTAVSVNYRMGFRVLPGEVDRAAYRAIQDVHAAVRFMLGSSDKYNIDPDRVYLAGCSAGAIAALHVALMDDAYRPEATHAGLMRNDLGPIDAIEVSPSFTAPFNIRGVCSMWGAVFSDSILSPAQTSILSIHDEYDPIVPYKKGEPFDGMLQDVEGLFEWHDEEVKKDAGIFTRIGNYFKEMVSSAAVATAAKAKSALLSKVYGSFEIEKKLNENKNSKYKHELITTHLARHTIIREPGNPDIEWPQFDYCEEEMVKFFRKVMMDRESALTQSETDPRLFYLTNADEVNVCRWEVTGGIITQKVNDTKVRLMLFDNGGPERISVSVNGVYNNGIPFEERYIVSK